MDELAALRLKADKAIGLLAAIMDSSDHAIVSKTLDGVITSWNAGAERLFGYTASEAVGRHSSLIIPANRRNEETVKHHSPVGGIRQKSEIEIAVYSK
jgi:PAS domain S-box-containing protein